MAVNNMEEITIKQEIEELVREEEAELLTNYGSSEENVCSSYSLAEKTQLVLSASKVFFTHFEKELILALAKPHLKIINSKVTNAATSAEKAKVFREITRQFNNTHGVNPRTEKQVRQCYQNLKKKLRKKSAFPHSDQEESGGVEVSKEPNLPPLTYQIPLVIVPFSNSCDSDTSSMEVSKPQENITIVPDLVCPLTPSDTPSDSTSKEASELDSLNVNCSDNKEIPPQPQSLESEPPEPVPAPPEPNPGPKASKENSLREMLTRFRKKTKPQTPPSAAARAAACIEAEHAQSALFMKKEEERKEQRAEAERNEQELRMEHLREKIKLTRTKTLIHERILELMDTNPECIKMLLKNLLSEE